MKKVSSHIQYLYRHHFIRYLLVGGTTFIIDESLLILLHGVLNLWLPLALVLSFTAAFAYNFSLNRWWAFSAAENNTLRKHLTPYTALFFFNLAFNTIFVSLASHVINYAVAKALAVIIQMLWTYFVYKNYIFIKAEQESTNTDTKEAASKA